MNTINYTYKRNWKCICHVQRKKQRNWHLQWKNSVSAAVTLCAWNHALSRCVSDHLRYFPIELLSTDSLIRYFSANQNKGTVTDHQCIAHARTISDVDACTRVYDFQMRTISSLGCYSNQSSYTIMTRSLTKINAGPDLLDLLRPVCFSAWLQDMRNSTWLGSAVWQSCEMTYM